MNPTFLSSLFIFLPLVLLILIKTLHSEEDIRKCYEIYYYVSIISCSLSLITLFGVLIFSFIMKKHVDQYVPSNLKYVLLLSPILLIIFYLPLIVFQLKYTVELKETIDKDFNQFKEDFNKLLIVALIPLIISSIIHLFKKEKDWSLSEENISQFNKLNPKNFNNKFINDRPLFNSPLKAQEFTIPSTSNKSKKNFSKLFDSRI